MDDFEDFVDIGPERYTPIEYNSLDSDPSEEITNDPAPRTSRQGSLTTGTTELSTVKNVTLRIKELYASYNRIEDVLELTDLPYIAVIDLERGNIISEATDYKERMKRYIPHLKKLDPAPRKFRIMEDLCKEDSIDSNPDGDAGNTQIKLPEEATADIEMSDNEQQPDSKIADEAVVKRFVEDNLGPGPNEEFIMDIEANSPHSQKRNFESSNEETKSRPSSAEDMKSTDDESGPSPQNILHDEITTDNTQQSTAEESTELKMNPFTDKKFCCLQHQKVFEQASRSIRFCASLQYSLPTCDNEAPSRPKSSRSRYRNRKEKGKLKEQSDDSVEKDDTGNLISVGDGNQQLLASQAQPQSFSFTSNPAVRRGSAGKGRPSATTSNTWQQQPNSGPSSWQDRNRTDDSWRSQKLLKRRDTLEPAKIKEIMAPSEEDSEIEELPANQRLPDFRPSTQMSGSYGYSNEEDLSTPRLRPTTAGGGGVKRPSSRSGKYSDAKSRPGSTTSGSSSTCETRPGSTSSSNRPGSTSSLSSVCSVSQASCSHQSSVSEADSGVEFTSSPGHIREDYSKFLQAKSARTNKKKEMEY